MSVSRVLGRLLHTLVDQAVCCRGGAGDIVTAGWPSAALFQREYNVATLCPRLSPCALTQTTQNTSSQSGLISSPSSSSPSSSYLTHHHRNMTSLSKTGIPGPDLDRAESLSQYYEGHTVRLIKSAGSVIELDDVIHKARRGIAPVHFAAAAVKLAKLSRDGGLDWSSNNKFVIQRIASQLETLATQRAPRLVASQIGTLLSSLSYCGHTFSKESLHLMAARVIAGDCQRLQMASEIDIRNIMFGFVKQGYENPVFWDKVYETVTPRLSSFDANRIFAILQSSLIRSASLEETRFVAEAMSRLADAFETLSPHLLPDIVQVMSKLKQDGFTLNPILVSKAVAQASSSIHLKRMTPKHIALLVSGVSRLGSNPSLPPDMVQAVAQWTLSSLAPESPNLAGLKPQYVAALVNALAVSGYSQMDVFSALARHVLGQLGHVGINKSKLVFVQSAFQMAEVHKAEGCDQVVELCQKLLSSYAGDHVMNKALP